MMSNNHALWRANLKLSESEASRDKLSAQIVRVIEERDTALRHAEALRSGSASMRGPEVISAFSDLKRFVMCTEDYCYPTSRAVDDDLATIARALGIETSK